MTGAEREVAQNRDRVRIPADVEREDALLTAGLRHRSILPDAGGQFSQYPTRGPKISEWILSASMTVTAS